ncbi:MAG: ABC transporter permease [Bacteroidota bacterium]
MDLRENVKEGLKSIKANKLRTILTALIIAFGITSLVGSLTVVDGIQASITSSFSNLGANTFDIESRRADRNSRDGTKSKAYKPLTYGDLTIFKNKYTGPGTVSLNTWVTGVAEVKRGNKVTNPNLTIRGGDEDFLVVEGYDIKQGRTFSLGECQNGVFVCMIGSQVQDELFEDYESPVGSYLVTQGARLKVVGTLGEEGGATGNTSVDRTVMVPIETARRMAGDRQLRYEATVAVPDPTEVDYAVGVATGLMRRIRADRIGEENSFEVPVSKSLAERLGEIITYLRSAGFGIGFITLLGASIALMNIMLVSVTERTREIGVRKALGATPLKIRRQFLIEAIVICQLGGVTGILFGLLVGNLLSTTVFDSPFVVPWAWIFFGLIVGSLVGLGSGYLPARKASRLDPIEALRFE